MTSPPATSLVPAVSQAFRILRHLAGGAAPSGVSAIARAVSVSPSSCHNLLKTLTAEGALQFDARTKTYSLGPALNDLARAPDRVEQLARPRLALMAARFDVASGIWALSGDRLLLVAVAESELATRIHMAVGQRLPMLIGAMGRCVAAFGGLDAARIEAEYARLRWARAPGLELYKRQVAQVKRRGWAVDDGEFMRGVTTVAAPVRDASGAVRHCVANTMFEGQASEPALRDIAAETAQQALGIAKSLYGD